jgi:RNA polymerase sigma-70 factor (ECF subfamily)
VLILYTLSEKSQLSRAEQIEEQIAGIANGNMDALSRLYELIKTDIYAYAISKLANKHDAEDITHDTFVLIYKHAKQYRAEGKPLAWIFTIELNLIRKLCNANKPSASLDEAIGEKSNESDFTNQVVNSQFLREVLSKLDKEEREIISLHVVSGLKHREIAKLLDKPLSTVLSKYNRAIKKLQAEVKEVEHE